MKATVRYRNAGFTLVEVVFAIMIVGLGVVAMMLLFAAGTQVNAFGNKLSSGVFLAEEMRSMSDNRTFDQLILNGNLAFNQAVDAQGNSVAGLEDYQQQLLVQPVNPIDLTTYIGANPQAALLTAVVSYKQEPITRVSWLRTP